VTRITRGGARLLYVPSHDEAIVASRNEEREMTKTKKILTGAAAAVALAVVSLSAGTTAAEAGWKHKHHHYKHFYGVYTVAPLAYYGYYNNCGWTWTKFGKQYVCF